MADKLRGQLQLDQLQNRFIGVGHADTTRHEWRENVARDSYASYIGHPAMLEHFSIGLGESKNATRTRFIDSMIQPCGPPPSTDTDTNGNGN